MAVCILNVSYIALNEDFGARSRYLSRYSAGCNYLFMPEIPASGAKVLKYGVLMKIDAFVVDMIKF